jgi:hypothetical protein
MSGDTPRVDPADTSMINDRAHTLYQQALSLLFNLPGPSM